MYVEVRKCFCFFQSLSRNVSFVLIRFPPICFFCFLAQCYLNGSAFGCVSIVYSDSRRFWRQTNENGVNAFRRRNSQRRNRLFGCRRRRCRLFLLLKLKLLFLQLLLPLELVVVAKGAGKARGVGITNEV